MPGVSTTTNGSAAPCGAAARSAASSRDGYSSTWWIFWSLNSAGNSRVMASRFSST